MRRALASAVVLATLLAGGCSVAIDWPKNDGDFACPPVQVVVNWKGDMLPGTFFAKLDNVNVTPQFFVSYPNQRASAQLMMPHGAHTLEAGGDFKQLFSTTPAQVTGTRTFTVPGSLSPSPNPLPVIRNSTTPLTVGVTACSGPMTVTLSGLPFGVAANPSTFTVNNPQAAGSVSQPTTAGASGTTSIVTSTGAAAGNHTVTLQGTAPGVTLSRTFTIQVTPPTISGVNPNPQQRGGTVTVSGTGFDPSCANNVATIGGVNVTSSTCSPAGTSASFVVPPTAKFGAGQLTVMVNSLPSSNSWNFTVARQFGNFVPITADVLQQRPSGRLCSPGGTVRVDVAPGAVGANTASYRRVPAGTQVGSLQLDSHTATVGVVPPFDVGGAGFVFCTHGLALDAVASPGPLALRFLDLQSGATANYAFPFVTPVGNNAVVPGLWRSQDGTIIMVAHASSAGNQVAVTLIDTLKLGQTLATRQTLTTQVGAISAQITLANQIVVTVSGTALAPITIP